MSEMPIEPHPYAGIKAADKDSLRTWCEETCALFLAQQIQLPDASYLLMIKWTDCGCGTYTVKTLDDLPLFSVPCTCGKGYFIKYSNDDYMLDWPAASIHGRELVLV